MNERKNFFTCETDASTATFVPFPFSPSRWHNCRNFVWDRQRSPMDNFSPCDSTPTDSCGACDISVEFRATNSAAASQWPDWPSTGICYSITACASGASSRWAVQRLRIAIRCDRQRVLVCPMKPLRMNRRFFFSFRKVMFFLIYTFSWHTTLSHIVEEHAVSNQYMKCAYG